MIFGIKGESMARAKILGIAIKPLKPSQKSNIRVMFITDPINAAAANIYGNKNVSLPLEIYWSPTLP